jgi:nicotinate-nucleotide adenylyltransferase
MRIGILGGTFDPVHYGHLIAAETCRERLKLDQVRLIPAASPPHKPGIKIADGHARADMLSLAVSGYPEFVVDRRELKRSGPSFTVDTLRELTVEFPGQDLYFLMGADSLRDLLTWREPEEIARLATIVACNRHRSWNGLARRLQPECCLWRCPAQICPPQNCGREFRTAGRCDF